MKPVIPCARILVLAVAAVTLLCSQVAPRETEQEPTLPGGKNQKEEILKAEYQKTLEDAGKLLQLAEDLKIELEKNERHVLSLSSLKKTEEIEKLAKRIRGRLKRQ